MNNKRGWIGVDLDGTLAHYDHWRGVEHIGEPVPRMLERVKAWLAEGKDVRIFTARVGISAEVGIESQVYVARHRIGEWCKKHLGVTLRVTATKDLAMVELWDDRCVQVIPNTGIRADEGLAVIKEEFARLDLESSNLQRERAEFLRRQQQDRDTIITLQLRLKGLADAPERPVLCPGCHNEIDEDLCHCGDEVKEHHSGSGHSPVPLGCECGRA